MKRTTAILLLLSMPALAEPPPGVDLSSPVSTWFRNLRDNNGRSCCGEGDCRPVVAKQMEGRWWVQLQPLNPEFSGEIYYPVPSDIVQQRDDNPTGHAILCASRVQPDRLMYCFIPMTGS